MLADLTLAGDDAVFGQVGPRMGSVDAGYGGVHLARMKGQEKAHGFFVSITRPMRHCKWIDQCWISREQIRWQGWTMGSTDGDA
jgi:hypothetical protein